MADRAIADRGKPSTLRRQLRIEGGRFGRLNGVDLWLPDKQNADNDDHRNNDEYRGDKPTASHWKFSREARQPHCLLKPVGLSNKHYSGQRVPCPRTKSICFAKRFGSYDLWIAYPAPIQN